MTVPVGFYILVAYECCPDRDLLNILGYWVKFVRDKNKIVNLSSKERKLF